MSALYACTKCHNRHPFEELSESEQLCQTCRRKFPTVKCTYCRVEFQSEEKTQSICKKCSQNVKQYGKPKVCQYCNMLAAFVGDKCQRCANNERKCGLPKTCEQCKQQCAFDLSPNEKLKVDGKLLCWSCGQTYRRVLNKLRQKRVMSASASTSITPSSEEATPGSCRVPRDTTPKEWAAKVKDVSLRGSKDAGELNVTTAGGDRQNRDALRGSSSRGNKHRTTDSEDARAKDGHSESKKAKLERLSSNGALALKLPQLMSGGGGAMGVMRANDAAVLHVSRLEEEVDALKKQVAQRDQQIADRDKKFVELRSSSLETERTLRVKLQQVQKQHQDAVDVLQTKIYDLQQQLGLALKSQKKPQSSLAVSIVDPMTL